MPHQIAATARVPTPPRTIAAAGPSSWPTTPDSNAPNSFDAPMNTASTASTRPRLSAGVTSGHEGRADEHADRVGTRQHEQRDERDREAGGDAERDRADAEQRDRDQQGAADATAHGLHGEVQRDDARADAGGRAQPAESDRAHAEAVLGDRGEQRHRAAEEHREQVERDRAQEDRLAAHEPQPLDRFVHARLLAPSRPRSACVRTNGCTFTKSTVRAEATTRIDAAANGTQGSTT